MPAEGAPVRIRLWDFPVRVVHWSFAVLVPVLWWTAEEGKLELHITIGLFMLGLVLFRLLWGFAGSAQARFSTFVRGPGAVLAHIRGRTQSAPGHNPLGALSVLALLGLLALQVGLGLFAQDEDGIDYGPLNHLVSYDRADSLSEWHGTMFYVLLGVIVVHLAAIVWYRVVRRDNLITPMITGYRAVAAGVAAPVMAPLWRFAASALVAAGVAWWISKGAPL